MADAVEALMLQSLAYVPEAQQAEFQVAYFARRKDRTVALLLSLFLGWLGVDRLYIGQGGLGVLKLLTAGVAGIWMFLDWFLIMSATDKQNLQILHQLLFFYAPHLVAGAQGGAVGNPASRRPSGPYNPYSPPASGPH
jgi:TM2 domain-containing membrane protein YozV